jgi:competence protein ComGC
MKRAILVLVVLLAVVEALGQNKSQVTVKGSEINNRVVVVTAQQDKTAIELQCNADMPQCQALKQGAYWMERLGKTRGMYECENVLLYRNAEDSEKGQPIGNYCLNQK